MSAQQSMVEAIMSKLNVDPSHQGKLEDINKYIDGESIQELFNELLVHVLMERPKDVSKFITQQLKTVKKSQV